MTMVDPALKSQILDDLERMTPEQQRRAADAVHSVLGGRKKLPPAPLGKEFLPSMTLLDAESAREMEEAIEEEFERVDASEW